MDTGDKLTFVQDENTPVLIMKLPEINKEKKLCIIRQKVDGKEFDLKRGADFVAPKIEHVTHRKITGIITKINGVDFSISGKHNLCLFFVSESIATLEAIINGHVRPNKSVTDVDFNIVIATEKNFVVPSILTPEKTETPPCGILIKCKKLH